MTQNDFASSNLLGKKIGEWDIQGVINIPSGFAGKNDVQDISPKEHIIMCVVQMGINM